MPSTIEYVPNRIEQASPPVALQPIRSPFMQRQAVVNASNNQELLDDDLVLDSRVFTRPAAYVEAKLNSRISSFHR